MWCTWNSNSPFFALQGDTRCGGFTNTSLVKSTHLELIERVFLQVCHLNQKEGILHIRIVHFILNVLIFNDNRHKSNTAKDLPYKMCQ